MLNEIKTAGNYLGVAYNYPGPGPLGDRPGGGRRRAGVPLGVEDHMTSVPIAAMPKSWLRDSRPAAG